MLSSEQQIEALSAAMSTLPAMSGPRPGIPPPARLLWARELIERWGVSIDPDKATLEAVNSNPSQMGNHGPRTVRDISPAVQERLIASSRDYVNANIPDIAQRIAAADTEEKKAALREELIRDLPPQVKAAIGRLEQINPEDLVCKEGSS